MKIDSKKLMIALLAITALLLLTLLIYGGFALGGKGGEESTPDITNRKITTETAESSRTASPDFTEITSAATDPQGITTQPYTAEITEAPQTELPQCSGRIEDKSDSLISLVIDWQTVSRSSDMATVKVTVKISSYSLFVSERNGCPLTFLGQTYTYKAPAINYDGKTRTEFVIHEQTVSMPLVGGCGSAAISTSWQFRGEYAGVAIDKLTLDGFIEIKD